jgi:hypothetical protein
MTTNLPSEAELDFNPSGWAAKLLAAYGLGDGGAPRRMQGWCRRRRSDRRARMGAGSSRNTAARLENLVLGRAPWKAALAAAI